MSPVTNDRSLNQHFESNGEDPNSGGFSPLPLSSSSALVPSDQPQYQTLLRPEDFASAPTFLESLIRSIPTISIPALH